MDSILSKVMGFIFIYFQYHFLIITKIRVLIVWQFDNWLKNNENLCWLRKMGLSLVWLYFNFWLNNFTIIKFNVNQQKTYFLTKNLWVYFIWICFSFVSDENWKQDLISWILYNWGVKSQHFVHIFYSYFQKTLSFLI